MTDVKLPGVGDKDPVRISKAIRDIAGPRNYLEFNSMGTEPDAPRSGTRIYFDDEDQAKAKSSDTLGMPFILPTWYSGNISIPDASGFWQRRIERYTGGGVITLGDDTYTLDGVCLGPEAGKLDVRAENLGGATIVGNWRCINKHIDLLYMDLLPADDTTAMFVVEGGKMSLRDTQTDISAYTNQKGTLGQFLGCAEFRAVAFDRDCTFHVGDRLTAQIFDIDTGCGVKFVGYSAEIGYTPGHYVDFSFSGTDCSAAIIMDVAHGLFTGTHFTGPGKAVSSGNGLMLRRGSTACLGNGVAFTDFYHACRIVAGGYGHMFQGDFTDCTYAFRKDSGLWEYVEADTTFTGVTNISRTDASANIYAGGAPSTVPILFNTAGDTIAGGTTAYIGVGGYNTTESLARYKIPCSGVLRNMYAAANGGAGAGKNFVYTLRVNTADTALTCTTADTTPGSDTTHSVSVTAGDYVCVKVVTDAGASARPHNISFEFNS